MVVKTITYRRVIQVRPYESETLEATAEVTEGDEPADVAQQVKVMVNERLDAWAQEREQNAAPW